jgi:hypothetical protein
MSLRLVEIRPRPMASIRPLGQEARPLCMILMISWPPVPPTLGHRGDELPDVLQSPLGKGLARFPRDPVASMFQRRGRFLSDEEGSVQLALVVLRAGGVTPLLLLRFPVRHLLPPHFLGRWDCCGSFTRPPCCALRSFGLFRGEDVCMEG